MAGTIALHVSFSTNLFSIVLSMQSRVTALEAYPTQLFKGNDVLNTYQLISTQTVLEGDVSKLGGDAAVSTYVARGTLLLYSNF